MKRPASVPEREQLRPAEAVIGFATWLQQSGEPLEVSNPAHAARFALLVGSFCAANNLRHPRDQFHAYLRFPTQLPPDFPPLGEPTLLERVRGWFRKEQG